MRVYPSLCSLHPFELLAVPRDARSGFLLRLADASPCALALDAPPLSRLRVARALLELAEEPLTQELALQALKLRSVGWRVGQRPVGRQSAHLTTPQTETFNSARPLGATTRKSRKAAVVTVPRVIGGGR